ncbi:MAG: type IA DNA topoisomerase, partial [Lachnospiraceae bacterium]|nr:type IA DNA topoisomerase [Lachnospiraceae bacterium]
FNIVKGLLTRQDVERIYVCTDSGREGEYIYRLVDRMAKVPDSKDKRRVWIDSQTEDEIKRGIREAKPLSAYDRLGDAAYLRAKEDYLMGINFSRALTLRFGDSVRNFLNEKKRPAISVGRVMTCVLGMVVRREQEIRSFTKTPYYRVTILTGERDKALIDAQFRAVEGSAYYQSPLLYKENGFKKIETAKEMIAKLLPFEPEYETVTENGRTVHEVVSPRGDVPVPANAPVAPAGSADGTAPLMRRTVVVDRVDKKKEKKNPPLLFNLAELQNECSKLFKISPDQTLNIVQELYEKKLVTYPRTDARVLSTAVAAEIKKNIEGLGKIGEFHEYVGEILSGDSYKKIAKTRYVNDKQITDHYAIIPTGQGLSALASLKGLQGSVYELIARRFLAIFYPPAEYVRIGVVFLADSERFFANYRYLSVEGYLKVARPRGKGGKEKAPAEADERPDKEEGSAKDRAGDDQDTTEVSADDAAYIASLKKGMVLPLEGMAIRESETAPPKRYNSGSLILAMENAGQLIEDEELRAQIKGSGIGTSATRAEILGKLVKISYLNLNKKTQIITPTLQGEMVAGIVACSIASLLNPELTASWEKGLSYVAEGTITGDEYLEKLEGYVTRMTVKVKDSGAGSDIRRLFAETAKYYKR